MRIPRNAHLWLPGYLASRLWKRLARPAGKPVDVLFCVADHFEPDQGRADAATRRARVQRWVRDYPRLADRFRDADGRTPRHSFFFPAEIYDPELVAPLAELCAAGYGEVEIHLHHDNDTSAHLRETLRRFTETLAERHGLLARDPNGNPAWGFIHGNWALDNSLHGGRDCGVNDEITVLRELGCYADFTMPSVPHESQARVVNRIYFAVDDPLRPASHRSGPIAAAGKIPPAEGLLMIPGPLGLDWRRRVRGVLPRIDTGMIDWRTWPTAERFARWADAGVGVAGRPEWVFIKVHTHGATERNAEVLLGPAMAEFHGALGAAFNDGQRYRLHYVTARELANIALAAIDGHDGNAGEYRDYRYKRTLVEERVSPAPPH